MSANKSKRLTLIRHANAEQDADVRDFERPLSRKGQSEALEMARRFQERGLVPDLILASAATRTRETAETFAKVLGVATRLLQADDALYLAEGDYILGAIRAVGPARRASHGHRPQPGNLRRGHFAGARSHHQRSAHLRHADDEGELRDLESHRPALRARLRARLAEEVLRLRLKWGRAHLPRKWGPLL